MKIKILLADDHRMLLDGLRSLLVEHRNWEVVGLALDGLEATELAAKLKPDVIIMDVSMPKLNGIEATRKILAEMSKAKIIMLSMHLDRRYITESLKAGAMGYILKESAFREVSTAISTVMSGEVFLGEKINKLVLQDYINQIKQDNSSPFADLSAREREVVQLLAEGHSTKDISGMLYVSVKTVESHRKRIMDKLNIRTIAELTKYAIREGLTHLE